MSLTSLTAESQLLARSHELVPQLPVLTGDWSQSEPFRAALRLLADCFAHRAAAQRADLLSCLEYENKRYEIWFWFGVFHAEDEVVLKLIYD